MKKSFNKAKDLYTFHFTSDEYCALNFLVCAGICECHHKKSEEELSEYRKLRDFIFDAGRE